MSSTSDAGSEGEGDPLRPHAHEPNPNPPSPDPSFELLIPGRRPRKVSVRELRQLSRTRVEGCYIVSTGHGTSGPFTFGGVALSDLLRHEIGRLPEAGSIEVISGDGFGTRIAAEELKRATDRGAFLLADEVDARPLSREEGLLRLIVPSERDDALRQVKWVATIRLTSPAVNYDG